MMKVIATVLLISVVAHAMPATSVDEAVDAPVAGLVQTHQAVAEQDPVVEAIKESDVSMSEQNKEAMENAETIGFGYHKTFYPRVYVPSYPVVHHAYAAYPILPHPYPGYVHYY